MRFMILVKATADSEAGLMPGPEMFEAMAAYHEELAQAGVLLDANGLKPSASGWRVRFAGKARTVVDGPFAEAKELVAGYTIIQTKTEEEARYWVSRFPNPTEDTGEIEVRRMFELEDFEHAEAVERFRDIGVGVGGKP